MTAGKVFHGTRVPLRVWFLAIFFLARHKQGISPRLLQRDAGLGSYQTAWALLHKLRSASAAEPMQRLTGEIEADKSYIGGPTRGWPGRGAGKTGVGVAVERSTRTAGKRKTWLPGTFHGVGPKHLQRYLDEFVFRFDRRWRETELFIHVLRHAVIATPRPYKQITAERVG